MTSLHDQLSEVDQFLEVYEGTVRTEMNRQKANRALLDGPLAGYIEDIVDDALQTLTGLPAHPAFLAGLRPHIDAWLRNKVQAYEPDETARYDDYSLYVDAVVDEVLSIQSGLPS